MNTLPDNIQDTIYKYKHQLEYRNVMEQLKIGVCYCGWCGQRQWTWTVCDCVYHTYGADYHEKIKQLYQLYDYSDDDNSEYSD